MQFPISGCDVVEETIRRVRKVATKRLKTELSVEEDNRVASAEKVLGLSNVKN